MEKFRLQSAYKLSVYFVLIAAVSIIAGNLAEYVRILLFGNTDYIQAGGAMFDFLNIVWYIFSQRLPGILVFFSFLFRFLSYRETKKWNDIIFIICSVLAIIFLPDVKPLGYVYEVGKSVSVFAVYRSVIITSLAFVSLIFSVKYLIQTAKVEN